MDVGITVANPRNYFKVTNFHTKHSTGWLQRRNRTTERRKKPMSTLPFMSFTTLVAVIRNVVNILPIDWVICQMNKTISNKSWRIRIPVLNKQREMFNFFNNWVLVRRLSILTWIVIQIWLEFSELQIVSIILLSRSWCLISVKKIRKLSVLLSKK